MCPKRPMKGSRERALSGVCPGMSLKLHCVPEVVPLDEAVPVGSVTAKETRQDTLPDDFNLHILLDTTKPFLFKPHSPLH